MKYLDSLDPASQIRSGFVARSDLLHGIGFGKISLGTIEV